MQWSSWRDVALLEYIRIRRQAEAWNCLLWHSCCWVDQFQQSQDSLDECIDVDNNHELEFKKVSSQSKWCLTQVGSSHLYLMINMNNFIIVIQTWTPCRPSQPTQRTISRFHLMAIHSFIYNSRVYKVLESTLTRYTVWMTYYLLIEEETLDRYV